MMYEEPTIYKNPAHAVYPVWKHTSSLASVRTCVTTYIYMSACLEGSHAFGVCVREQTVLGIFF